MELGHHFVGLGRPVVEDPVRGLLSHIRASATRKMKDAVR